MIYAINKLPRLLLTLVLLFNVLLAYTQANGRLSGRVIDRTTQMPLTGISVSLQGTAMAAMVFPCVSRIAMRRLFRRLVLSWSFEAGDQRLAINLW